MSTGYDLLFEDKSTKLDQYRYNTALDAKNNIFRVSNEVIESLIAMQGPSWRMFESIAKSIDIYPLELKANADFIDNFQQGKRSIPPEFRTVTICAADYIRENRLSNNSGRKQFVKDAIGLFNEVIEVFQGDVLKVARPVTEIDFHIERKQRGASSNTEVVQIADMMGDKPVATQAARITFELNDKLALAMLFVVKNFTRLNSSVKSKLSPSANKLYTYLKMRIDAEQAYREQHFISWDLATWNRFLNTKHKSISRLAESFKFHTQITENTDLTVIAGIDKEQKIGRAYSHFYVGFMNTPKAELIEQKKAETKPTRKRLPPRPKVLKGSDAEGKWARKCLAILKEYEKDLKAAGRILPKADRDRRDRYNKIIGR